MANELVELLGKNLTIGGSILAIGILAIQAITKYVTKRDSERDEFFKTQLEKKDTFYQAQLDKKDKLIDAKDQELKELNNKLTALTERNIEINKSLSIVIEKALRKGYYKPDDE